MNVVVPKSDGSLNAHYDEDGGFPSDDTTPLLDPPAYAKITTETEGDNYDDDVDFEKGHASVLSTAFNMANTVVGSGIIGLPSAIKQAGLGLGIILLVLVAILTEYSLDILIIAGRRTNTYEYPDVFKHTFGRPGFIIANLVLMLNSAGGCVSYFVILGDTVPAVLGYYVPDTILGNRQIMVVLIGVCLVFPLTLVRDVSKLALTSLLSISCIPFIVIAVAIQGYTDPRYERQEPIEYKFANADFFPAIGTMAFAYVCCQASFILYKSLAVPTRRNWLIASSGGVGIATCLCIVFAVVGYCAFGDETQGNILNNFAEDDLLINVARMALAVTMVLTFPFAFMVVRMACARLIGLESHEKPMSTVSFVLVTIVLFAILQTVGAFVTDLGLVYSLMGGLWSVAISYFFPAIIYIAVVKRPWLSKLNIPAWFLLIFGLVTMVVSTTSTIISIVNDSN